MTQVCAPVYDGTSLVLIEEDHILFEDILKETRPHPRGDPLSTVREQRYVQKCEKTLKNNAEISPQ